MLRHCPRWWPRLQAGGTVDSRVLVQSFEQDWGSTTGLGFNHSFIEGPQLGAALLATHLNGQPRIGASRGTPGASWAILVNHLFNTGW